MALFESVLIIGPTSEFRDSYGEAFRKFGCQVSFAENYTQAQAIFRENSEVDVILIEVQDAMVGCLNFIRGVRKHDLQHNVVFVVCDHLDSRVTEAFFEGADGVFAKPMQLDDLSKAVAMAYATRVEPPPQRLHPRKRITRTRVSYSFESSIAPGYATNIGLGGLFIGTMDSIPPIDKKIEFTLMFDEPAIPSFSGMGFVRWERPAIAYGRPRGFGLEFDGIKTEILDQLMNQMLGQNIPTKR